MKIPPTGRRLAFRATIGSVCAVALLALAYYLLAFLPEQAALRANIGEEQRRVVEAENATRATGAQIFLGLGILVGLYLTHRRIRASERQAKTAEEGQITERFTRAIEQLGTPDPEKMAIRLGGVYALERILRDSPGDAPTVQDVLAAFVREESKRRGSATVPPPDEQEAESELRTLSTDLQAALTVLGRNPLPGRAIDLTSARLVGADLSDLDLGSARLDRVDLTAARCWETNLTQASLTGAVLCDSDFEGALLIGARLEEAKLTGAMFFDADLTNANLAGADLSGADLYQAHLIGVVLKEAKLIGADLSSADFSGATFLKADLTDANLHDANLRKADFTQANLTGANLRYADLTDADMTGAIFSSPHLSNGPDRSSSDLAPTPEAG